MNRSFALAAWRDRPAVLGRVSAVFDPLARLDARSMTWDSSRSSSAVSRGTSPISLRY